MRTYGRISDEAGNRSWQIVTTDYRGNNDAVWVTTLAQVLYLTPGESPFYANYGIPARQSVLTQIAPDFYVALTQQQFSRYFASLTVTRLQNDPTTLKQEPIPTYQITVVSHTGAVFPGITVPTSIPV